MDKDLHNRIKQEIKNKKNKHKEKIIWIKEYIIDKTKFLKYCFRNVFYSIKKIDILDFALNFLLFVVYFILLLSLIVVMIIVINPLFIP